MQMPADILLPSAVDDRVLGTLVPIGSLPSALRTMIATRAMVYDLAAGGSLQGGDSELAGSLFLVQGSVILHRPGSELVELRSGHDAACFALYGLAAEGARIEATTESRLLQVDGTLLASLLTCVAAGEATSDQPWLARLLASEPFSRLPPAGLYRLGSCLQQMSLEAGEYAVRQGEAADYYYLLSSGQCAIEWRADTGDDAVVLATVEAGDGFGEEALLGELPRATSVRTLTHCTLLRLTRVDLEGLMHSPAIARSDRADAERRIAAGAYWLDVRLPEEHAQDAPSGSVNVPLRALAPALQWLGRDSEWIVCCDSGLRSEAAVAVLAEQGYNARHLQGGLYGQEQRGDHAFALGDLQRQRAVADAELETALHETAVAQAAAMPALDDEHVEPAAPALQQEAALRAQARLDEAIRRKLELDTRTRHLEAEMRARREHALAETARLRKETEGRLSKERERLSEEVSEAAAAMQALRTARKRAEAQFAEEQRALNERMLLARQELDAQARRIRDEMLQSRQNTEQSLQRIRTEHGNAERDMLRTAEVKLRTERGRLQSEFASCVQAEAEARAELESIEQAQREALVAASQERERLAVEAEQRREQRATALRAEQERLATAAHAAGLRVADAERLSDEAQARRAHLRRSLEDTADHGVGEPGVDENALKAELAVYESHAEGAASQLREAREGYKSANRAQLAAETRSAREQAAETELRLRLYEELEEALTAEQEQTPTEQTDRGAGGLFDTPHGRGGDVDDPLPEALVADLKQQLEDGAGGDELRSQFLAVRSQLTRAAMADATEQKSRARTDLERARQHLASLRDAARRNAKPDD